MHFACLDTGTEGTCLQPRIKNASRSSRAKNLGSNCVQKYMVELRSKVYDVMKVWNLRLAPGLLLMAPG